MPPFTPSSQRLACAARPRGWVCGLALLWLCGLALGAARAADRTGTEYIRFEQFTVADGLSQATVRALAQDTQGFLWLATQDGLNRFDGYEFQVYRHQPDVAEGLPDNHVHALAAGRDGSMWVGTQTGQLARFDPWTHAFTRYPLNLGDVRSGPVSSLLMHPRSGLWIGTQNGHLLRLRDASAQVEDLSGPVSARMGSIRAMHLGRDGSVWIVTAAGLWHADAEATTLAPWLIEGARPDAYAVAEHLDGGLMVGTATQGVWQVDAQGKIVRRWDRSNGLPNDGVRDVLVDRGGRLWIATLGGLALWDPGRQQLSSWLGDQTQLDDALSASRVESLFEDRDGLIWVGTWVNGVNLHDPRTEAFGLIRAQPGQPRALEGFSVPDLIAARRGGMWLVVQEASQVVRFVPGEGVVERIEPGEVNGLGKGLQIRAVAEQGDRLWVALGGQGLLERFEDGRMRWYRRDEIGATPASGGEVYNLYVDPEQTLWVGALGDGLFRRCQACDTFEHFPADGSDRGPPSQDIGAMLRTRDGSLWVGTRYDGLARLDPASGRFEHYPAAPEQDGALGHASITSMKEDAEGRLWVGTQGGGFHGVERDARGAAVRFTRWDRRHGLGADAVGDILQDASGALWLSTTSNLARFDPESGNLQTFGVREGAVRGGYYIGSAAVLDDQQLAFGGLRGVTLFDPRQVQEPPAPRAVAVAEVRLPQRGRNRPQAFLSRSDDGTSRLLLPPGMDAFSFDLTALSFSAPKDILFQYRLDPLDRAWSRTDASRRFASYTHVPPGNYVFRARAQRGKGEYSEELVIPLEVTRVLTAADWLRFGAIGLAVLFGMFLVVQGGLRQRERARAQARLAESEQRLKLALWGTGDELWDLDLDTHRLHRENPLRYLRSFGEEEVADVRSLATFVHPDDLPAFNDAMRALIQAENTTLDVLTRVKHTDGSWVWLRIRGRIAGRDALGRAQRLTGTVTDVTELKSQQAALERVNDELEQRVEQRTHALTASNASLKEALGELQRAQEQLVEQEKMAALGALVAGIAHEINTPLGIGVTTASHLELMVNDLRGKFENNQVARRDLEEFLQVAGEASELIMRNLKRADGLVRSFKQVAVDQSSEYRRSIDLAEYLDDVMTSLRPAVRKAGVTVDLDLPGGILLDTFPGAIYRVISNLVQNSLIHGFAVAQEHPRISIRVEDNDATIRLVYSDNGVGMSEAVRRRIFEPFFTTRRGQGGSGLGMHIVFNTVTQVFGGRIRCISEPGQGVEFDIDLPRAGADAGGNAPGGTPG